MSGTNFERAKLNQAYEMPLQRPSCENCHLRMAHHMQCGRGGFFVQSFGICSMYQPKPSQAEAPQLTTERLTQAARVMYTAFLRSAHDQKKSNPNLWVRDQPAWEALNPEMQTCWIEAAKVTADQFKTGAA